MSVLVSESKFRAVGAPVLSKLGTYFSNGKVNGIDYYVDDPIGQIKLRKLVIWLQHPVEVSASTVSGQGTGVGVGASLANIGWG